jgi:hypothetical protein
MSTPEYIEVNQADWDGPVINDDEVVWNAPRPLYGETFQGKFRSGIFYAVTQADDTALIAMNKRDGAVEVRFITNQDLMDRMQAKLSEYGYRSFEQGGFTPAELARSYGWPWVDEDAHG